MGDCYGATKEQETNSAASLRMDPKFHGYTADPENDYREQMPAADLRESSEPRRYPKDRQHDVGMDTRCEAARWNSGVELENPGTAVFVKSRVRASQYGTGRFCCEF